MDWQLIIACVVVAAAVARVVAGIVRSLRGKDRGCGCGCDGCSLSRDCRDKKNIKNVK